MKEKKPNYHKIYDFVKKKYEKTKWFNSGPFDESFYSLIVYNSAKEIMKEVNCDKEQVLVASLLHDVGKTKLPHYLMYNKKGPKFSDKYIKRWKKHAKLSVPIARNFLKKHYDKDFIDKVCYLIENHANRKQKDICVELQVLQDADLIADIGFTGFIRPFLYGVKFNRSAVDTLKYIAKNRSARFDDLDELNLEVSKKIAKQRLNHEKDLNKEILNDVNLTLTSSTQ